MKHLIRKFIKDESASVTLETLMWIPVYIVMLGLVIDSSSIALTQSRMQAAVTDAARLVAIGRLTEQEAITLIQSRAYEVENFTASISTADSIVTASVTMPLGDLIGIGIIGRGEKPFGTSAHFVVES